MPKNTSKHLDATDRAILSILQENGRITNTALAKAVHLSVTPCLERVKRLQRDGYIRGYNAELNAEQLDAGFTVFVAITLEPKTEEVMQKFASEINELGAVTECHMVGGEFDMLAKVQVADMAAYRDVLSNELSRLPALTQTVSFFVIEKVKEMRGIPVPQADGAARD